MKDVSVTVIAAIALAIVFMYVLLSFAFSGWGDRAPQESPTAISGTVLSWTLVDS